MRESRVLVDRGIAIPDVSDAAGEDYIRVEPGASLWREMNLADGYDIAAPGAYKLALRMAAYGAIELTPHVRPADRADYKLRFVESDAIALVIQGSAAQSGTPSWPPLRLCWPAFSDNYSHSAAGTEDTRYVMSECDRLATFEPNLAVPNAQNDAYFVMYDAAMPPDAGRQRHVGGQARAGPWRVSPAGFAAAALPNEGVLLIVYQDVASTMDGILWCKPLLTASGTWMEGQQMKLAGEAQPCKSHHLDDRPQRPTPTLVACRQGSPTSSAASMSNATRASWCWCSTSGRSDPTPLKRSPSQGDTSIGGVRGPAWSVDAMFPLLGRTAGKGTLSYVVSKGDASTLKPSSTFRDKRVMLEDGGPHGTALAASPGAVHAFCQRDDERLEHIVITEARAVGPWNCRRLAWRWGAVVTRRGSGVVTSDRWMGNRRAFGPMQRCAAIAAHRPSMPHWPRAMAVDTVR